MTEEVIMREEHALQEVTDCVLDQQLTFLTDKA
jgi:hypothetical protein